MLSSLSLTQTRERKPNPLFVSTSQILLRRTGTLSSWWEKVRSLGGKERWWKKLREGSEIVADALAVVALCFMSIVGKEATTRTQAVSRNSILLTKRLQMDDWEDEPTASIDLKLKDQPKSKWDDEDVDDNDVKESWEDEDEPAPTPTAPGVKATEKAPKKSDKATENKGKKVEPVKEEPLDPVAEKLRQQRLVEEADYKSTQELFSGRQDEKNLDTFIPKSESDFSEYAQLIAHKLHPFEKSYHYIVLLKAVMRLSMTSLKGADAKDIASSVTAIANEKIKAEKEANAGKKKTGGKKKQLNVDKPDEDLIATDQYDAMDDYDFM
ncbi:hypothetical protein RJT34_25513 [Clitoria ternatea]|uniref:Eukaryotic translation initiation factor 3 subunit J n=1 Tax=Clitoria ternatea TaxID=43366 RepID=A0AAN9IIW8_CLITE